jgi:spermidine/putrescine-binding protein
VKYECGVMVGIYWQGKIELLRGNMSQFHYVHQKSRITLWTNVTMCRNLRNLVTVKDDTR